jgi:hypothetical protein
VRRRSAELRRGRQVTEAELTQAALLKMTQTIGGLVAPVDTLTRQWRDQDEKARSAAATCHQKIDRVVDDFCGLVKAAISDIVDMKLIVDAVEVAVARIKHRAMFNRGHPICAESQTK